MAASGKNGMCGMTTDDTSCYSAFTWDLISLYIYVRIVQMLSSYIPLLWYILKFSIFSGVGICKLFAESVETLSRSKMHQY